MFVKIRTSSTHLLNRVLQRERRRSVSIFIYINVNVVRWFIAERRMVMRRKIRRRI